jgi:hypothetical protein
MTSKGPTDNSIRDFRDTYDEVKRYRKKNKRIRHKTKVSIKKMLEKGEYEDDFNENR